MGIILQILPPSAFLNPLIRQVLGEIVRHRLHRLYVVGDGGQALGVVTLTDILRQVCPVVSVTDVGACFLFAWKSEPAPADERECKWC